LNTDLNPPMLVDEARIVPPTIPADHRIYDFWMRITTLGDSWQMFGPNTLNVGCMESLIELVDSSSFVTQMTVLIGEISQYMFTDPEVNENFPWCKPLKNSIE
jgi:hypothetical protein